jgi:hypothetical protein
MGINMIITFENGLPLEVISEVLFAVDPVELKEADVHPDEYIWEAELLQSVPLPISDEDVYMVFDTMFNRITDDHGIAHHVAIVEQGNWCAEVAAQLNIAARLERLIDVQA